eukprot:scaffold2572_cov391-Prasinococcus_capsulatus_cf.AAC.9
MEHWQCCVGRAARREEGAPCTSTSESCMHRTRHVCVRTRFPLSGRGRRSPPEKVREGARERGRGALITLSPVTARGGWRRASEPHLIQHPLAPPPEVSRASRRERPPHGVAAETMEGGGDGGSGRGGPPIAGWRSSASGAGGRVLRSRRRPVLSRRSAAPVSCMKAAPGAAALPVVRRMRAPGADAERDLLVDTLWAVPIIV